MSEHRFPGRLIWLVVAGVALAALLPGPTLPARLAVGVAWAGLAGVAVWLAERALREQMARVLDAAARALERARAGEPVAFDGPPELQELVRRAGRLTAEAEERNRQSQVNLISLEVAFDRIHSVLQSLQEAVVVIDAGGEVVLSNPAARGYFRDGVGAHGRFLDAVDPELAERLRPQLARVATSVDARSMQSAVSFGERLIDVSVSRVRSNRPDQDFGVVLVLVDVTHAHEVARLKDGFLSSMSHELRTPLTNICSFAELLQVTLPTGIDAECAEFVDIIGSEARRLGDMVQDVLDYSALEQRPTLAEGCQVSDACAAARAVVERFRPRAAAAGTALRCTTLDGAALVRGSVADLDKLLSKLVDNALKFTPAGGRIEVDVQAVDSHVQLSVCDDGPGVVVADRETVFERFTQIGDHLVEKPSGAGLGLPIARRLVDCLGGNVWCEDAPPELGGAAFRVILPRVDTEGRGLAVASAAAGR